METNFQSYIKQQQQNLQTNTSKFSEKDQIQLQFPELNRLFNFLSNSNLENTNPIQEQLDTVLEPLEKDSLNKKEKRNFQYTYSKFKSFLEKEYKIVTKGHYKSIWIGIGMALGMPLGLPFGVAMDNIAIGLPLGIPIGLALGLGIGQNFDNKAEQEGRVY